MVRTAPQAVDLPQRLYNGLDPALIGERAKDRRAIVRVTGHLDPGGVVVGQLHERVGLVVLQPDVVPGSVSLDQVCLKQECLRLGVGDGGFDPFCLPDHPGDPLAARVRIRGHPVADRDGLADIEDPVAGEELVDAGLVGEFGRSLSDRLPVHTHCCVSPAISLTLRSFGGAGVTDSGLTAHDAADTTGSRPTHRYERRRKRTRLAGGA